MATAAFITFCQQGEEDFHFIPGLLNVADVIENQEFETVQAAEFGFQCQVAPGAQKTGNETKSQQNGNHFTDSPQLPVILWMISFLTVSASSPSA